MNSKNIAKHLHNKLNDWVESVKDDSIKNIIKKNAIVTGGAIVSLLNSESPNDYDIYFKNEHSCYEVANYYASIWNKTQIQKPKIKVENKDGRISCFIEDKEADAEDKEDVRLPDTKETKGKKDPYRPKYFTTNAVSLSDGIQLVIRFYGSVEEIHTNYDFAHCTCSYDFKTGEVNLPSKALECIINKELFYMGSKYPLCSIIRTRKFLARGYHINAGQYLKMAFQLNELNLKDFNVLKDQLAGVDSLYFGEFIKNMEEMKKKDPNFNPDSSYFIEAINRIF